MEASEIASIFSAGPVGKQRSAPPAPVLAVFLTDTRTVVLSWPSSASGFALQQNFDLTTTNWTATSETVADNGTNRFIIVNPATGKGFYRLSKP